MKPQDFLSKRTKRLLKEDSEIIILKEKLKSFEANFESKISQIGEFKVEYENKEAEKLYADGELHPTVHPIIKINGMYVDADGLISSFGLAEDEVYTIEEGYLEDSIEDVEDEEKLNSAIKKNTESFHNGGPAFKFKKFVL